MLNKIWPIIIISSFIFSIVFGNIEKLNNAIFESTEKTIKLTMALLGSICLWSGIMKIASNTSIVEKLLKVLNPIINILFPELKNNKKIKKEVSLNMISNIMGLGNASTPMGIKAIRSMQEINENKGQLSKSMKMFILINTASIQIIPTTVFAVRKSLNSNDVTSVILPIWISTILAAFAGVFIMKLINKKEE